MKAIDLIREKISWKNTGSSVFLVFNSFVWYIITYIIFSDIIKNRTPQFEIGLYSIYYISVAIAAISGAKIFPRFRLKSLIVWMIFGAISTFLLFFITDESFLISGLIASVLGISVGIGLPSCLSFFADITKIENRSFVGGIIWSLVGVFVLGFAFLYSILIPEEMLIFLISWRILGVLIFKFLSRNYKKSEVQEAPSYFDLLKDKKILLYLFPWLMFSIINFAEAPIIERAIREVGEDPVILSLITWSLVGLFAIIGGYIADVVGRKRVIIAGFVMLGIEYATMSTFYNQVFAAYLFTILDGVSWGLLFSVFFMSLWGDLGQYHIKEKYYVLGGLPYLLANFLYVVINSIEARIPVSTAFTVASFFLFLAILPLIYTTETLPEKKIKERELKNYLDNAQKIRDKYS
jgi:MFS family permease